MKIDQYIVLGVMSGTSLDGVDLALIRFKKNMDWTFEILGAQTVPYPETWELKLKNAMHLTKEALEALDKDYTCFLGSMINDFLSDHNSIATDAVCSHGHTVFHQPEKGVTVQIGNRPELAVITGRKVICDFRVQDVFLGGQGAPLVPIGDKLLFGDYSYCLNLGGFANVSLSHNQRRVAYDLCAVNTVLNHYSRKLGFAFDKGGAIAKAGAVNERLLDGLNALPFYQIPPPKSLGMEWVETEIFPLIDRTEQEPEKILATYTRHVSEVLARECSEPGKVLVTGGGAYNAFLIEEFSKRTDAELVVPGGDIVDFKEALIFGFLGVLRLRGEVNCLKSVTGAVKDHSSGVIYEAELTKQ